MSGRVDSAAGSGAAYKTETAVPIPFLAPARRTPAVPSLAPRLARPTGPNPPPAVYQGRPGGAQAPAAAPAGVAVGAERPGAPDAPAESGAWAPPGTDGRGAAGSQAAAEHAGAGPGSTGGGLGGPAGAAAGRSGSVVDGVGAPARAPAVASLVPEGAADARAADQPGAVGGSPHAVLQAPADARAGRPSPADGPAALPSLFSYDGGPPPPPAPMRLAPLPEEEPAAGAPHAASAPEPEGGRDGRPSGSAAAPGAGGGQAAGPAVQHDALLRVQTDRTWSMVSRGSEDGSAGGSPASPNGAAAVGPHRRGSLKLSVSLGDWVSPAGARGAAQDARPARLSPARARPSVGRAQLAARAGAAGSGGPRGAPAGAAQGGGAGGGRAGARPEPGPWWVPGPASAGPAAGASAADAPAGAGAPPPRPWWLDAPPAAAPAERQAAPAGAAPQPADEADEGPPPAPVSAFAALATPEAAPGAGAHDAGTPHALPAGAPAGPARGAGGAAEPEAVAGEPAAPASPFAPLAQAPAAVHAGALASARSPSRQGAPDAPPPAGGAEREGVGHDLKEAGLGPGRRANQSAPGEAHAGALGPGATAEPVPAGAAGAADAHTAASIAPDSAVAAAPAPAEPPAHMPPAATGRAAGGPGAEGDGASERPAALEARVGELERALADTRDMVRRPSADRPLRRTWAFSPACMHDCSSLIVTGNGVGSKPVPAGRGCPRAQARRQAGELADARGALAASEEAAALATERAADAQAEARASATASTAEPALRAVPGNTAPVCGRGGKQLRVNKPAWCGAHHGPVPSVKVHVTGGGFCLCSYVVLSKGCSSPALRGAGCALRATRHDLQTRNEPPFLPGGRRAGRAQAAALKEAYTDARGEAEAAAAELAALRTAHAEMLREKAARLQQARGRAPFCEPALAGQGAC